MLKLYQIIDLKKGGQNGKIPINLSLIKMHMIIYYLLEVKIQNPKHLAHLKSYTIMMKSLHSEQSKSQAAVDFIKLAFDEVKEKQDHQLKKVLRHIVERQDRIEKK